MNYAYWQLKYMVKYLLKPWMVYHLLFENYAVRE